MPQQRSRSEERDKKHRQRRRWSDDKKEEVKAKEMLRKREKRRHEGENISNQVVEDGKIGKSKTTKRKEQLKSKELSEYEIIRQNNIIERLDAMVESGLWSKEEVTLLKNRYML